MAALRCAAEKGDINELQKRLEAGMKGWVPDAYRFQAFSQQPVYKAFKNPQPELNVDFVKKKIMEINDAKNHIWYIHSWSYSYNP